MNAALAIAASSSAVRVIMGMAYPLGPDRLPGALDDVFRRRIKFLYQRLHPGARQRRDIDAGLLSVGQELWVAHGGVEGGAQNARKLRRRAVCHEVRPLEG